ncbi:MAG: glycosyltransferase family 1 protein [Microbacterium sp.]|uniref:rhamnosyltransferase WsaF family glycosyltransferase n=1 Tax=Microbacterium sp. TaxID=51671 RepID=UPI002630B7AB|nr:glycosyltransferase family 1 protein [Microbacterium sp.]MCX6502862.1 glycosyltransferase family 1 protein [Microbacterium sp.]
MSSLFASVRGIARKSPREIVRHALRRWSARLDVDELDFPLLPGDMDDSQASARATAVTGIRPGGRLLGWIVVPPGAGSGGHTTLFRMMEAARAAGFVNTLLFYDRYHSDHARNVDVIRSAWPWLQCEIEEVGTSLAGFDGIIASSWPTAHVASRRRVPGQPVVYFIQDFEPYFYPRGSEYAIAEDSYRLGLRNVALGDMVRERLATEVGLTPDHVPFGCDTGTYHLLPSETRRSGVLFYAKRGNDRRGHRLAVLALTEFHRRHPEEPIHTYGDSTRDLPFPVVDHGNLPPSRLNELYNTVVAGIALSFTNISLVAEEMLAAGVIPVVNRSPMARADLPNPHVAWAHPTPAGIADGLDAALRAGREPGLDRRISASVTTVSWEATGARLARIIADEVGGVTAH